MSKRKIGGYIFGTVALIICASLLYQWWNGMEIDFSEIISAGIAVSAFFTAITWGSLEDGDGPTQEEELGKHISARSAKISYFVLVIVIFLFVLIDQMMNQTENITLITVLALSIVIMPATEFFVARKYR